MLDTTAISLFMWQTFAPLLIHVSSFVLHCFCVFELVHVFTWSYSAFTETGATQTLKTNQMAEPKQ